MNPEAPKVTSERQPLNWTEILRCSFMFAQGMDQAHKDILFWLAQGPLAGIHPTDDDFTHKKGVSPLTVYASRSGAHAAVVFNGVEYKFFNYLKDQLASPPNTEREIDLVGSLLERDIHYLVRKQGRPIETEIGGRDIWSSFVIDFGILKKGTPPWTWNALPTAYKEMWEEIVAGLRDPKYRESLSAVAKVYLSKHPHLSGEDREKIEAFIAQ